ncbi:MAG: protein kinase [Enterobacterales bacterium]|nr:protein kinase [Enterobacterales bacterium]
MPLPSLTGYEIKQQLASGGMAKIYDATQISLNRPVAIKFLSRSLLDHSEAMDLFERESLIIAQLNHPNIVQVFDKGISEDSQPYFVMEKINGIDLSQLVTGATLPFGKQIDIAIQICKGLAYAHKNHVIHRDIKPANVIIDQHGHPKILDFGIALTKTKDQTQRTRTTIIGTEGYIAPEQEGNYANATIASDIYSFGKLLKDLFQLNAAENLSLSDNLVSDIPQIENSKDLMQLIEKCCHPEPDKRYADLADVRDHLLRISQGSHLNKTNIEEAKNDTKDLSASFDLLDVLCKTHQKRVYLFQKKSNQKLLVIKQQKASLDGLKHARLLCSIKHPNIVQIYAAANSGGNFIQISEYLSGGSLANQLLQEMEEPEFLSQACQIASAMTFAHKNNIKHCNLSPENILFDQQQNIKIGDFGQIRSTADEQANIAKYHPPSKQAYSEQYDIYCMGAIFHHMLYGFAIGGKKSHTRLKPSFRLQKLIDQMLAIDPVNRPTTAQQILVELQKISRLGTKKEKNTTAMQQQHQEKKTKIKKKAPIAQKSNVDHSKKLSIALGISLVVIVVLLVKVFVK